MMWNVFECFYTVITNYSERSLIVHSTSFTHYLMKNLSPLTTLYLPSKPSLSRPCLSFLPSFLPFFRIPSPPNHILPVIPVGVFKSIAPDWSERKTLKLFREMLITSTNNTIGTVLSCSNRTSFCPESTSYQTISNVIYQNEFFISHLTRFFLFCLFHRIWYVRSFLKIA
jgi:hypothetical protein